jgi:tetratricopeptide (TPR) repeat protein
MFQRRSGLIAGCVLLAVSIGMKAQTFEIHGKSSSSAQGKAKQQKPASREGGMGWGSSIEVARQARAAQDALRRNNYTAAMAYAQRAVRAAPNNSDFWFLLAYSARLAGRYTTSVDAYNRGLQLRPSSVEGLSGLAQTYAKMGKSNEARQLLDRVLTANPRSANDLRLAGELLLGSDPKQALSYLQRAESVAATPRNELLMARAYQRLNNQEEARKLLERARSRAPHDPQILRAVAGYYRDTGRYDQALKILQSVPLKDASGLAELAYTYLLAGKRKEAADTYVRAADAAKGQIEIQLNAAQALISAGSIDRAQSLLQRAEGLDTNHYRLHALRGQIHKLEHHDEDAIREYQIAVKNLPESVPEGVLYPISLHIDLYQLYRDSGQTAEAQREIETAQNQIRAINIQDENRPEFLRLRAAIEMAFNNSAAAEKDLKEALALQPGSTNLMLNYANLLWKTDRQPEALKLYTHVLTVDPRNAAALSSLGYLSRQMGDRKAAEEYFQKLAGLDPENYVAYLALGDLYTERREFPRALASYEKAHKLAPSNPLVFAGAINASLESHQFPVAESWLHRANARILQFPQVMREHERYLTMTGKYQESAELGYKVIEKLPRDPEAPVYLAYDLLFLNRYKEAMEIVERFKPVLPKDKDLWLIAGYIHAHDGDDEQALRDFTEALARDPNMSTGYMNRGYVLNDMRMASQAEQDFKKAIQLRPDYGEAHLGLAYSYLQLRRAREALKEADNAERILGESRPLHLARAEAFRQQVLLAKAEAEYRAALKFQADDVRTYLAMAEAEYGLRRYETAVETLNTALKYAESDEQAPIYASMARSYAQLGRRQEATDAITKAERASPSDSKILLSTAQSLMIMGERDQAMERYTRALDLSEADRLKTRLALARLFVQENRWSDAQEQIGWGFAEARVSDASVIEPEDYLNAADVLMSMNQFPLAQRFLARAQAAGADELAVAIRMANAHLAKGETQSAESVLTSVNNVEGREQSFDYLVALGNVYRQQQDARRALSAFARANRLQEDNTAIQRAELQVADEEGRQITDNLSVQSNFSFTPLFEDENIYQTDARLRGIIAGNLLPTPRHSLETIANGRFRLHVGNFPVIHGFVAERNARGTISFPSELLVQDRNTYDTIFNGGVSPVLRLGNVKFTITPGLQFTIRRDAVSPRQMNQNLFRQYLYVSSSSIGNWLSFSGDLIRQSGPFTEQNLHSRDFSGGLDFRVGRPWGKTALITGFGARDVLFRPAIREYYQNRVYIGLERKFSRAVTASLLTDYSRAWRVEDNALAIAQSLRPGFGLSVRPSQHWTVNASGFWSQGKGFHAYDNVTGSVLLSYTKALRGAVNDGTGAVSVNYPLRFSVGVQQQTFYDFPGGSKTAIVPVIQLTFF